MLVVCVTPLFNTSYCEAPRGLVDSVSLIGMVSHGRGGLAGPHAYDYAYASARDSDSSLREPEPLDEGDLPPHRVLGRGGIFSQNIKVAPLSGAAVIPLDSTSTRVGTLMGGSGRARLWSSTFRTPQSW